MLVLDDDGEAVAERTLVLARLDTQISEARDEEISRKDVLERMERWQAALEEETWLEEYSRVRLRSTLWYICMKFHMNSTEVSPRFYRNFTKKI
jgi:hypothetical protein